MKRSIQPYKPKIKLPDPALITHTLEVLRRFNLTTVCEASACPNRNECYSRDTTTFMILGDTCTRACRFCNVKTGQGHAPETDEPERIANAIEALGLRYAVITSVDRDDLDDYGSGHFVTTVHAIKKKIPDIQIELLTPDFRANPHALKKIVTCGADKLAHNEETVRRISTSLRPQSSYDRSLQVLSYYASHFKGAVKSSLMVGLGEKRAELIDTMEDLLKAGVTELTIGQYLQPTPQHHCVERYYPPEWFEEIKTKAYQMGFSAVASGVLVRSSYNAEGLSRSKKNLGTTETMSLSNTPSALSN